MKKNTTPFDNSKRNRHVGLTKDQLIKLYVNLVRSRKLDEICVGAKSKGMMYFFHSGQGEEAVSVGGCTFLRKDDYLWAHLRGECGPYLISKGVDPKNVIAELYGKATGMCYGMSGLGHPCAPELGIVGTGGTIGSQFPISTGLGLAAKKNGKGQVVICFFGDGSSNRGTLHESFNLASLWKLPIVWVCQNNLYAMYMPVKDACARENIADLAASYNMPGLIVDGQDVLSVYEAINSAVEKARAGKGPSLIECKTYRYRSHNEGLPDFNHADLRDKKEIEAWKKRDPINLFREKLLAEGILDENDVKKIDAEADAEIREAERYAMESPLPERSLIEKTLYVD